MRTLYLAALVAALSSPAGAVIVYSNNFDAENGGNSQLNYNAFNGLTVTDGTVDLVKSGEFGITCAGGTGSCVDLDGSTNDAGLTSSAAYAFNAGDKVALSFDYSGNQRSLPVDFFRTLFRFVGSTESGTFGSQSTLFGAQNYGAYTNATGLRIDIFNIPPGQAMTDFTFFFVAGSAGSTRFSFEDFGNDNVGVVIDNVSLSIAPVPEPASWAMMIAGFGLAGMAARRRIGTRVTYA